MLSHTKWTCIFFLTKTQDHFSLGRPGPGVTNNSSETEIHEQYESTTHRMLDIKIFKMNHTKNVVHDTIVGIKVQ